MTLLSIIGHADWNILCTSSAWSNNLWKTWQQTNGHIYIFSTCHTPRIQSLTKSKNVEPDISPLIKWAYAWFLAANLKIHASGAEVLQLRSPGALKTLTAWNMYRKSYAFTCLQAAKPFKSRFPSDNSRGHPPYSLCSLSLPQSHQDRFQSHFVNMLKTSLFTIL